MFSVFLLASLIALYSILSSKQLKYQCGGRLSTYDEITNISANYEKSTESYYFKVGDIFSGGGNQFIYIKLDNNTTNNGYLCVGHQTAIGWDTSMEDHFTAYQLGEKIEPQFTDFNGDNIKDIAIASATNYQTETSYNLWLVEKNNSFIRVDDFDTLFSPKFNSKNGKLTSYMTVGPARGGFVYDEYLWSGRSVVKTSEIKQELVNSQSSQVKYKVTFYKSKNGTLNKESEIISNTYYKIPGYE